MWNRRSILKTLACAMVAPLASLFGKEKSNNPRKGEVFTSICYADGSRFEYNFFKGPDYTDLESAYPHMQAVVDGCNGFVDQYGFSNSGTNCLGDNVVILQSVSYFGKIKS